MKKFIIDTCGADCGEETIVAGCAREMKKTEFFPILCGTESTIRSVMKKCGISDTEYEVIAANDIITNHDAPMCVMGERDSSSMVLSFKALKKNEEAVGLISAGNTGAMLISCILHIGTMRGVRQPALASTHPVNGKERKFICIADCGANLDCKPTVLVKFAHLASAYMKTIYGIENPRVGLLSVGIEIGKGNKQTAETFDLLAKEEGLNFVGNIEGGDICSDTCDVVLSDGYGGNIMLKGTEAIGIKSLDIALSAIAEIWGEDSSQYIEAEHKLTEEFLSTFDYNSRGGAVFLGTKKPVVKMHGAANEETVGSCIRQLLNLNKKGFTEALSEKFAK